MSSSLPNAVNLPIPPWGLLVAFAAIDFFGTMVAAAEVGASPYPVVWILLAGTVLGNLAC